MKGPTGNGHVVIAKAVPNSDPRFDEEVRWQFELPAHSPPGSKATDTLARLAALVDDLLIHQAALNANERPCLWLEQVKINLGTVATRTIFEIFLAMNEFRLHYRKRPKVKTQA